MHWDSGRDAAMRHAVLCSDAASGDGDGEWHEKAALMDASACSERDVQQRWHQRLRLRLPRLPPGTHPRFVRAVRSDEREGSRWKQRHAAPQLLRAPPRPCPPDEPTLARLHSVNGLLEAGAAVDGMDWFGARHEWALRTDSKLASSAWAFAERDASAGRVRQLRELPMEGVRYVAFARRRAADASVEVRGYVELSTATTARTVAQKLGTDQSSDTLLLSRRLVQRNVARDEAMKPAADLADGRKSGPWEFGTFKRRKDRNQLPQSLGRSFHALTGDLRVWERAEPPAGDAEYADDELGDDDELVERSVHRFVQPTPGPTASGAGEFAAPNLLRSLAEGAARKPEERLLYIACAERVRQYLRQHCPNSYTEAANSMVSVEVAQMVLDMLSSPPLVGAAAADDGPRRADVQPIEGEYRPLGALDDTAPADPRWGKRPMHERAMHGTRLAACELPAAVTREVAARLADAPDSAAA